MQQWSAASAQATISEPMRPFRVLFLHSDPVTAEARIRPLLDFLQSENRIIGYAVVDRDMSITGAVADHYDTILTHRNPSIRQMAWLRETSARFAYDIDDLLLDGSATKLSSRRALEFRSVAWCLTNAQCITAPSQRLITTLETRVGVTLQSRSVLLLNTGVTPPPPEKIFDRPRLLWVSSTALPAYDDILAACRGINAAAHTIDTDIVLVGRFAPEVVDQFSRCRQIPWLPTTQYRSLLAEGPFIAVAPLPMGLPPDKQAFFDCKSDIKAAEYGSSRIAGVYSPAPPYAESDLPCCLAPENTADAWQESILNLAKKFPAGGNALAEHPALSLRRPGVVARQLAATLSHVRNATERPVRFRAVPTPAVFRKIERGLRKLRSRIFH